MPRHPAIARLRGGRRIALDAVEDGCGLDRRGRVGREVDVFDIHVTEGQSLRRIAGLGRFHLDDDAAVGRLQDASADDLGVVVDPDAVRGARARQQHAAP